MPACVATRNMASQSKSDRTCGLEAGHSFYPACVSARGPLLVQAAWSLATFLPQSSRRGIHAAWYENWRAATTHGTEDSGTSAGKATRIRTSSGPLVFIPLLKEN